MSEEEQEKEATDETIASDDVELDTLRGSTLTGGFKIGRRLGAGGMGAVYEAQSPDGRAVAIKVMRPDLAKRTEGARRFLRETKAVRAIASDHVTRLLGDGTDATTGAPFLVMELLHGQDLGAMVRTRGPLMPGPAVALFVDACRGIAAAHALGIVHRDIKPANLFVHEEREDGADGPVRVCIKVCDFGVAKHASVGDVGEASTDLTRTGGMLGSPIYMSPEQARNAKTVDHRTDVWSLAISLHEVLSGVRPWAGCTTMGEIILAICTEPIPKLADLAPWLPAGLASAIDRGLAKEPADRYASVEDFARALEPFAAKRPLSKDDLVVVDEETLAKRPAVGSERFGSTQRSIDGTAGEPRQRSQRVGRWPILAGGGVAIALVAALGFLSTTKPPPPTAPVATGEAPTTTTASTPASTPSAIMSASFAPEPSIVPSAEPKRHGSAPPHVARPATAPSASVSASASAPPTAAPTVGRGGIATDLSFSKDAQ